MKPGLLAYGTDMIRSAIDRSVSMDELDSFQDAIAIHTGVSVDDICWIYAADDDDDDDDNNNDDDDEKDIGHDGNSQQYVLHHFVAIDHISKNVILALRGTLNVSGAIVDIEGMAGTYALRGITISSRCMT